MQMNQFSCKYARGVLFACQYKKCHIFRCMKLQIYWRSWKVVNITSLSGDLNNKLENFRLYNTTTFRLLIGKYRVQVDLLLHWGKIKIIHNYMHYACKRELAFIQYDGSMTFVCLCWVFTNIWQIMSIITPFYLYDLCKNINQ